MKYGLPAYGALALGKNITGIIGFYTDLAKRAAKYLKGHHAYLERDGAYALAINALVDHLGGTSKSIVLEGYMVGAYASGGEDHMVELTKIGEAPPHDGAFVPHHFQFTVDGEKRIKVVVDTAGPKVFELPPKKPTSRTDAP